MTVPDNGARTGRRRDPRSHAAALNAALELLSEVGLEQLTMDAVAHRAGVSKATLYRWWSDKTHLVIEAVATDLGPPLQSTGDTTSDIRALVEWTVSTIAQRVGDVFVSDLASNAAAASQLEDLIGPHRAAIAALLLGAAGRGDLPYDLDVTATLDLLTGIAVFRKLMNRPLDTTLVDQLTALLLNGHLPRTAPSTGR
ncbi:MAG TPA: helix-turn-helix domain-containing protein [Pseudonocardia sp.]|nr:helix-turn-helix domain-containing protein [Pseudonocardia sp.]